MSDTILKISNKYTIFVVADNCDDSTAKIARKKGAIVYERFDENGNSIGWCEPIISENPEGMTDCRFEYVDGQWV